MSARLADTPVAMAEGIIVLLKASADLATAMDEPDAAGVADRIWDAPPPPDAVEPYILVQIIEPRDVGPIGSTIIFSQGMATVKVVGRAESYETLAPIAKAMHEAIQGSQHVDVSGGGVLLSARRRSALSYPEESNGIEYRHLGGAYEVTAQ